jgi:hypothetical protein
VVSVAKKVAPERVRAVDMNNTAIDSACINHCLLRMSISLAAKSNKIYVCELYQLTIQASATYSTRANRGTWNDFQWHAELIEIQ